MKILIVDDDAELRNLVGFALRQDGHETVEAPNGRRGLVVFAAERPELVILDVNMPELDGFATLKKLREFSDVPVLMLTVRSGEADQVLGLDLGADDYLGKPFSLRTLSARVRALSRRSGAGRPNLIESGELVLDMETQTVRVGVGPAVGLTGLEARLLQQLMSQAERAVPFDQLARQIWGYEGIGDRTRLKQLVHRLRLKLEPEPADPRFLLTIAGSGYLLRPTGQAPDR